MSSVWTTASFSVAISSTVSPRTSVCSSPTFVSRTTRERSTFVASWRPPSPASTTATSTLGVGERRQRGGRDRLELRRADLLRRRPDARERGREVGRPPAEPDPLVPRADVRRDRRADGEPVARAAAARSSPSRSTCRSCRRRGRRDSASCGSSSAASSAFIRSSPKPSSGQGLSPASQATSSVMLHGVPTPCARAHAPSSTRRTAPCSTRSRALSPRTTQRLGMRDHLGRRRRVAEDRRSSRCASGSPLAR